VIFDGDLIGCTDVDEIQGGSAEFGYWFDEACWGKGVASEAAAAVKGFALNCLGLERLETGHAADNPASGRLLTKLGFEPVAKLLMWYQPRQEEIWHQTYVYEVPR
jgi:ribosomal-protein-alanine N-acetyltransferase